MNRFLLVTNSVKDADSKFSEKIISSLEKMGGRCLGNILTRKDADGNYIYASPDQVPKDTEFIIQWIPLSMSTTDPEFKPTKSGFNTALPKYAEKVILKSLYK